MMWLLVGAAALIGVCVGYVWGFGQGDMEARMEAMDTFTDYATTLRTWRENMAREPQTANKKWLSERKRHE